MFPFNKKKEKFYHFLMIFRNILIINIILQKLN